MKQVRLVGILAVVGLSMSSGVWAEGHTITQAEFDAAAACPARGMIEARTVCACNADAQAGTVWGSNPYTSDSVVCTAAQHAGALEAGVGMVVLLPAGAQEAFEQSTRNGVTTSRWGAWDSSFTVLAANVQQGASDAASAEACPKSIGSDQDTLSCVCPDNIVLRSVWGSGPYTADSDLCTAARHAGVIGRDGGVISVTATEGLESYEGSGANGVDSRDWGIYGRSITFTETAAGTDTSHQDAADECRTLPSGTDRYQCICPANGKDGRVWGAGPYTSDSDICTAARHDGVIAGGGGPVTVLRIDGLGAYADSPRNGVRPSAWRQYGSSIVFDRNASD